MREVSPALFLHPEEELVIVVRVVVGERQFLHPRLLGHLDGLLPAAMAPAFPVPQRFRRVLGLVDEQIRLS